MRTFYRTLRILSIVTLFFFCWTFMPLWQIAAYAAEKKQRQERQGQGLSSKGQGNQEQGARVQGSGERFEKALEGIREHIHKAETRSNKGEEPREEVDAIRAKKSEIESIDSELKTEFAATEKKLKDAHLPGEILERHNKFVKHYQDNLKELIGNLEQVEKAQTRAEVDRTVKKAKLHLEKTKSPRKHKPLDPNNLPHRMVKAKEKAPRLKKEQFEKDFPPQRSLRSPRTADLQHFYHSALTNKPILVASNGSLAGLLSPNPQPEKLNFSWPSAISNELFTTSYEPRAMLLAQAAQDLPTAEDLAETPDIQFTDAIRAKAQELGNNPVKIYEWVRNNIEFVPTYGSIQGADMCLQTKQCNAFDTSSLLIALLRASNISARYAYGTIELPIDKAMNWAGSFNDPVSAVNFFASGGVPVTGQRLGGIITSVKMEHVWVRAFVDYIPSMGAVHKQGDTWIPLDASYKQYAYSEGVDFQTVVPFDGQTLANQIKATATINEQEGYVTNVNSALIQTAQSNYNAQLDNYVTQNLPNATTGDILGKKEIIKKEQPILPASLPYKVVVAGTETSEIPDQLRHKITVQLSDADSFGNATFFTYTANLPQLAGKRFTVSYDPATAADQTTINKYVEQYATSIPAYLVQFKPVLKIEGATVATGVSVGMGNAQDLTITITSPKGTEIVTHSLLAGDYTAIGLNPSKISLAVFQNRVNKNDFSEPVGEMLHQTALSYWAEADAFNDIIAKTLRVNNFRHPSELAASAKVSVSYVWGLPSSATYNRRNMDVKFDNQTVFSKSADKTKEFNYMQQSGITSSFLEGAIMDQLFGGNVGDSISAVTALKAANDQGIPIYKIDSSNITMTLPKLQVADVIKSEISNAINAGLSVLIPQTNITKSGWTGVGYIVANQNDGSGAYRISRGINGGDSNTGRNTVIPLPQLPLNGPISLVLVGFSSSVGTLTATEAGVLTGIAVAPALIDALIVLAILVLIWAVIKTLVERSKAQPKWEFYRHFTSMNSIISIIASNTLIVGAAEDVMFGAGVYLTKRFDLAPDSYINNGVMGYGPQCYKILTELELFSIEKTQGYIDFSINVNQRIVSPKRPPEEYLLIGLPGEIIILGEGIRPTGYWYPGR